MTYAQELKEGCGILFGSMTGSMICGRMCNVVNCKVPTHNGKHLCKSCKDKAIGYKKANENELEFLEFPAYCVAGADCCKKICQDRITYLENELKILEED